MIKGFTVRAVQIGTKLKGNEKAIARLQKAYEVIQKRLKSMEDANKAFKLAFSGQYLTEILDTAKGKGYVKRGIKKLGI